MANSTMTLRIGGNKIIENPSDEEIATELWNLDMAYEDSFAILGTSNMTYIQVYGDKDNGFILEYQEGSLACHYKAIDENIPCEQIVESFIAYRCDKTYWRDMFVFKKY